MKSENLDDIRAISQSIIPWSGDKSHLSSSKIVMDNNIICLKFDTISLSLSYPPSAVVIGSFRQRNYSIYPKVADLADKTRSK